ncbi:MAG TPA: substrate-binding domain-containing protein [Dermatophilaceae bacterium]|nr:substrate-binding domain-containing protein [Dermatophilaceae bacterium]
MHRSTSRVAAGLAPGLIVVMLAACTGSNAPVGSGSSTTTGAGGGGGGGGGKKVALLLPESKTTRYDALDRPLFEAAVKSRCADCQVTYSNAGQDASKQQEQFQAALAQGANVIVLDPVDGKAAESLVDSARRRQVPVIAYDRFIAGANYYVSYRNEEVGKLQAQTLVDRIEESGKTSGKLLVVNGSPTDPNTTQLKKGAHSVLDGSGFTIAAEYDTPAWSPDKARDWVESQLGSVKSDLVGVYAANDGTAGGAITALEGGGVKPLPPVTGQDAELAAIQRLVAGQQTMTVYKAIKPQARDAAWAAIALAGGQKATGMSGDTEGVPTTLLNPVVVTVESIKDTVVADGVYKLSDICTGDFAAACTKAGLG